jgi:signal transduction histidine kinase
MRELSLHMLDLIENSLRAAASIIAVTVEAEPEGDRLRITIEDNGSGLKVKPEEALDPFYTTKTGKRTGLGLSLFKAAAEATGGRLTIGKSDLGDVGVRVTAELGLTHIDRAPLGDLAGTLASVVCTYPGVDFRF